MLHGGAMIPHPANFNTLAIEVHMFAMVPNRNDWLDRQFIDSLEYLHRNLFDKNDRRSVSWDSKT